MTGGAKSAQSVQAEELERKKLFPCALIRVRGVSAEAGFELKSPSAQSRGIQLNPGRWVRERLSWQSVARTN